MAFENTITKSEPSTSSAELRPDGAGSAEVSLFGPEPVRVRDLIGQVVVPETPCGDRKPWSEVSMTSPRRGGRLHLTWYDYGVIALVLGSLLAGTICLLHGV